MVTYAAVVRACGKGWMAVWALQVFEQVRLQALQPELVTYTAEVVQAKMAGRQSGPCSLS